MASRAQKMIENNDAWFYQGLGYLQALADEGRSRIQCSIPGALVAEILRYIENSMPGTTQRELEIILLRKDHEGAEWRAYVAHRRRSVTEKRLWRTWYGRYGKKDAIYQWQARQAEDAFSIQPPPTEDSPPIRPPYDLNRPIMKGLPQDGRGMSFEKMREILKRWNAIIIQRELEKVEEIKEEKIRGQQLLRALFRHEMGSSALVSQINSWEAIYVFMSSGQSCTSLDAVKQSFFSAREVIVQRENAKVMASLAALKMRYPDLEIDF